MPELIRMTKQADGGAVLHCVRADGSVTWRRHEGRQAAFFPLHDLSHYPVETGLGCLRVSWPRDGTSWTRPARRLADRFRPRRGYPTATRRAPGSGTAPGRTTSPPNFRSRRWNSETAVARSAWRKSGHSTGVKYSSA